MCIRDRVGESVLHFLVRRRQAVLAARLDVEVGDGSARGSACLLYTSDAADERSSVDLGGRRIIKKKKNGN